MLTFALLTLLVNANIWDNIITNSKAPYVQLDDNFQATIEIGTFINNSFLLSFNSLNNSIRADYSISINNTLNLTNAIVNFTSVSNLLENANHYNKWTVLSLRF